MIRTTASQAVNEQRLRWLTPALVAGLLLAACGSASESTTATPAASTDADSGSVDTTVIPISDDTESTSAAIATGDSSGSGFDCDEIAAAFVTKGSANADLADPEVSATCEGDTVAVTSNGIPDYTYIETSPGSPAAQDLQFNIPATPAMADEPTDVALLGAIAVAINGVPIYGPTEAQGADVLSLAEGLSQCGSHNGPTGFHYHLHDTSDGTDCLHTPEDAESGPQLFGFSLDGYPIYTGNDQYNSSWELTDESLFDSDTWAAHSYIEGLGDLDQCNGLSDDGGHYAYYTTDTFPYILGCYSGVVDLDAALVGDAVFTGGP